MNASGRSRLSIKMCLTVGLASCALVTMTTFPLGSSATSQRLHQLKPASRHQEGTSMPTDASDVSDEIGLIGESLPSIFTGLESRDGTGYVVYAVAHRDPLEAALAKSPAVAKASITWVTVPNSLLTLRTTTDLLSSQNMELQSSGVRMVSWGPDVKAGKVRIRLDRYSDAAKEVLEEKFGAAKIIVDPSDTEIPSESAYRYTDESPYYGGDALLESSSSVDKANCTGGFNIIGAYGGQDLTTAGHCFIAGREAYNGVPAIGTVASVEYTSGQNIDVEVVHVASVAGRIWDYNIGDPTGYSSHVTAYRSSEPAISTSLCLNGAITYRLCNGYVESSNPSVSFKSGHVTCDLTTIDTATHATALGDSGGPVYGQATTTKGVDSTAYGLIVGGGTESMPGRTYDVTYMERMANILSFYGATLAS